MGCTVGALYSAWVGIRSILGVCSPLHSGPYIRDGEGWRCGGTAGVIDTVVGTGRESGTNATTPTPATLCPLCVCLSFSVLNRASGSHSVPDWTVRASDNPPSPESITSFDFKAAETTNNDRNHQQL